MGKKPLPLRIDEDLLRRVDERRRVLGQTRTLFVERALESALGVSRGPDRQAPNEGGPGLPSVPASSRASAKKVAIALEARDAVQQRNAEMPSLKRGSAIAMDYRCPVSECERRFGSPQAVCPSHGRKAVKA